MSMMEFLKWKNISTKRQRKNGTQIFELPIKIHGTRVWPLAQRHYLKIPSAQIKTALIYAGLQTPGITEIVETPTRDHAEIILKHIGADLKVSKINNNKKLIIENL